MGTEVQYKMYLPGYYSVGDLNDSTGNGGWASYHENKTFGQYYGIFSARPVMAGYMGYDKEHFRQTILNHETVFKHQLNELHRLYKIQMDMMNEVRSKEPPEHLKPMGTSHSILAAFPSKDDKNGWCNSCFPLVDCNHHIPSASFADSIQSHFTHFSPQNVNIMRSGCGSTHNGPGFKDHESLESKHEKLQRRLFDLELPAEKYINDEEEGQGVSGWSGVENYPPNGNCYITFEKNGNLSIHNGTYSGCNGDALSSNVHSRTQVVTDLNEPIRVEEASGTASVDVPGNVTCSKVVIPRGDLSVNFHSSFQCLGKEVSLSPCKEKGEEVGQCNPYIENERRPKGWLSCTSKPGGTTSNGSHDGGCHLDYMLPLCESSQIACRKATEPNQSEKEQCTKKIIFGVEISKINHGAPAMASDTLLLQPLVPQSNVASSESSCISSWNKLPSSLRHPSFNSFPGSNESSVTLMQGPDVTRDHLLVNSNLQLVSCSGGICLDSQLDSKDSQICQTSVGFAYPNGINDRNSASEQVCLRGTMNNVRGSDWSVNAKSAEVVNLAVVPPKSYQNEAISDLKNCSINGLRKEANPQRALPWLTAISLCNDKSSKELGGSHQMNLDALQNNAQRFVSKADTIQGPSQSFIHDSSSETNAHEAEDWGVEGGDCSGNRKTSEHIPKDLPSASSALKSCFGAPGINSAPSIKVGLLHTDLNHDPMLSELEEMPNMKSLTVENGSVDCSANLRNYIDLNVSVTEEEAPLTHLSPRTEVNIAVEIDLEAPIAVESEIGIISRDEYLEIKLKEPFDSFKDESKEFDEGFLRVAAEALVAISTFGAQNFQDNDGCYQLEADSLQWFAEIISSHSSDIENDLESVLGDREIIDHEDSTPNGIDYFEYMTLNLTESKVEVYSYEPQVLESTKDEITLPRRPRRGQGRRGRQRKDFQRDILPNLASLSRNDVSEDLYLIEGLIRATGGTWQSGLSLRNSPKSKGGRGRKRSAGSAISPTVNPVSPVQTQQPKCGDMGLEKTRLTGWGKRTRRPPRQRFPINHPPSLVQ